MLADQVVSAGLYNDALLLSHLARSVLSASCAAVETKLGRRLKDRNAQSCAADPRFMAAFGDQDTMEQMARLYRRIAVEIGATAEAQLQLESMIPATAAGRAFDLVGMISGQAPHAKIVSERFKNPFMVDFLAADGPGTRQKASKVPLVLGAIGVVVGGVAVGWALTKG